MTIRLVGKPHVLSPPAIEPQPPTKHTVLRLRGGRRTWLRCRFASCAPSLCVRDSLARSFIEGMGKVDERFVIILNVDHVLSLEEISTLAGIDQGVREDS